MSLKEELDQFRAGMAEKIPPEVREIMGKAIEEIRAAGLDKKAPAAGAKAPDFDLPDATGKTVSSAELRGKGPMVLTFYRGEWCPFCNLELNALQKKLPEIEALGASLVAVSPQTPDHSLSMTEKNNLSFAVLSDVGNTVARKYGLTFSLSEDLKPVYKQLGIDLAAFNGTDDYELPMAATFVIDEDGAVLLSHVDADYTSRLEPDEIVAALKQAKA